jgi:hypothetical protein
MEKPAKDSQSKRAINQLKVSAIRQVGNVLIKSLTAVLSKVLKRH